MKSNERTSGKGAIALGFAIQHLCRAGKGKRASRVHVVHQRFDPRVGSHNQPFGSNLTVSKLDHQVISGVDVRNPGVFANDGADLQGRICDSERKPRGLDRSARDVTGDGDRFALVNPGEPSDAASAMLDFPTSGQPQFTFDLLALDQFRKAWHTRVGLI